MAGLVRVRLDDGGWLLVEAADGPAGVGPVKAGRAGDLAEEMSGSLRATLRPAVVAAREVLAELRGAGPDELKVEFGVKLSASAGAVLTKGAAECHLKVTLGWSSG